MTTMREIINQLNEAVEIDPATLEMLVGYQHYEDNRPIHAVEIMTLGEFFGDYEFASSPAREAMPAKPASKPDWASDEAWAGRDSGWDLPARPATAGWDEKEDIISTLQSGQTYIGYGPGNIEYTLSPVKQKTRKPRV